MDRRRRGLARISLVAVCATLSVASLPLPAPANIETRRDGNDTRGPLDLRSVRIGHDRTAHVVRITTISRFRNTLIKDAREAWFFVGIDLEDDDVIERGIYLYSHDGQADAVMVDQDGDLVTHRVQAERPNSRSIEVSFSPGRLSLPRPASYRLYVASVVIGGDGCSSRRPCVDTIPNRVPLILHDYTAPKLEMLNYGGYSTWLSADTTFPVRFRASDDQYGSGIASWEVQRLLGTWSTVASGTGGGELTVPIAGAQGELYTYRVLIADGVGNQVIGPVTYVSIPHDDDGGAVTYGGPGETPWTLDTVTADSYLQTLHTTSTVGAWFEFTSEHGDFCVIGDDSSGTYQFYKDGAIWTQASLRGDGPRGLLGCFGNVAPGSVIRAELTSGALALDGVTAEIPVP